MFSAKSLLANQPLWSTTTTAMAIQPLADNGFNLLFIVSFHRTGGRGLTIKGVVINAGAYIQMRYRDNRVDAPVFRKVQAIGIFPDFRNNLKWTGSLLAIFSWWITRQIVSAI